MGTRGLLGFIIRAQRHAAYNHYDSYPEGLGVGIVKFLLSLEPEDIAEMDRKLREVTWVEEDSTPSKELQEYYSNEGFVDLSKSSRTLDDWYCLLNKVQGAAALPAIQSGKLKHLAESVIFLKDTLFCEWAYFIDFEKQRFEIWTGDQLVEEFSFEELRAGGMEAYLNRPS